MDWAKIQLYSSWLLPQQMYYDLINTSCSQVTVVDLSVFVWDGIYRFFAVACQAPSSTQSTALQEERLQLGYNSTSLYLVRYVGVEFNNRALPSLYGEQPSSLEISLVIMGILMGLLQPATVIHSWNWSLYLGVKGI